MPTTQTPSAICCAHCGDKLDGDDLESPLHDEDGDKICESCYSELYEGTCNRCQEIVDKKELAMQPGELLSLWEEVEGLRPGYYRVVSWPIYADGMIEGHIIHGSINFYAPLDAKGKQAAEQCRTPGGCLCTACRDEIESTPRIVRTFKDRFAPLVEAGTKLQTVRLTPKRMPKPGWLIDCRSWTGLPYRSKQRQLRVGVITLVALFEISASWQMSIDGRELAAWESDDFGKQDGFRDANEMLCWFDRTHGLPFTGILIQWRR